MSVLKITDNNAIETDKEFDALMAHQKRKNIAVASTNYTTKWVNRYERDEKLEVWNEAYNRKIATLIIVP